MDKATSLMMTEIENHEIEEVDDQEKLRRPEMTVNPQENEAKLKEIVDDEMAPDVGSGGRPGIIEKVVNITKLKKKQDNPT
ncbi:MAG: hypothetical protein Q9187_007603, partial [Circinaria calcarea]